MSNLACGIMVLPCTPYSVAGQESVGASLVTLGVRAQLGQQQPRLCCLLGMHHAVCYPCTAFWKVSVLRNMIPQAHVKFSQRTPRDLYTCYTCLQTIASRCFTAHLCIAGTAWAATAAALLGSAACRAFKTVGIEYPSSIHILLTDL